jgi:hypothetical protein
MIDQELDLVGTAFADVHLDGDARDVISRGRTLRRRRKALPALATAGIVAVSLSLAVATQSSPSAQGAHALGYNGSVVNVDEAGFSVHTDAANGTVTVNIKQLFNASELRTILAKAGIPAAFHELSTTNPELTTKKDVSSSAPCNWTGAARLPVSQADQVYGIPVGHGPAAFTIHPAKMPAGSVLAFAYEQITSVNGAQTLAMGVAPALLSGEPTGCVAQ